MAVFFLVAFLAGLLLLVYSMLHGVERHARPLATESSAQGSARPYASSWLPMLAAFAAVLGATGYLLVRYTALAAFALSALAVVAGILGALGALILVAKWAVPGALADAIDERYLLQGQFATVTAAIGVDAAGAVRYETDGTMRVLAARSIDGSALASDTEVVIDRVDDDVAYVEPWSRVEQRI